MKVVDKVFELTEVDIPAVLDIGSICGLSFWSRRDYELEIAREDSFCLGVKSNNELSGFIAGRLIPGSESVERFDSEIHNIGVVPKFQRTGVGQLLLKSFIERCLNRCVQKIWLEVRAGNFNAISFYTKYGFEPVSIRKSFYADPVEDAMIMRVDACKTNFS